MDKSDWMKGIFFSVLASVVGAASKLAIRKSWLMEEDCDATAEAAFLAEAAAVSDDEEAGPVPASRGPLEEEEGVDQHRSSPSDQIPSCDSNVGNPNEACEAPPEDEPVGESNDTEQPSASRKRGKSIYTAVQPSSSYPSAAAASTASAQEVPEIESTPPSTTVTRRRLCCTMPQFLRLCGMCGMTFLNPILCVLAMNYASPSILAPFSGLTLVWVIVLSRPLIGESPTMSQKVASSLIVMGEVIVAMFGDHTNDQDTTISNVEASYRELPFVLYFIGLIMWMLLMTLWIASPRTSPTLQRFAWGASGGSLTGVAQCFIKDSLVVLKASKGIFRAPLYMPLFMLLGMSFSFSGLLFLTATMKRYDATYSAAMFVGSFVVSASIMSAAHYHTFEHLAGLLDYIMYPVGLCTLMVGVHILVDRGTQTTSGGRNNEEPDSGDAAQIIFAMGDGQYEPPAHPRQDGPDAEGDTKSKVLGVSDTTLTTDTQRTASTTASHVPEEMELVC